MAEKIVKIMSFAGDTERGQLFESIVANSAKLVAASAYKSYGHLGLIEEVKVDNYKEEDDKLKSATLEFSAMVAGLDTPRTISDLAFAFDNSVFKSVINSITARTIATVMANYKCPQIDALAQRDRVEVGGSMAYEIKSKALPEAQEGAYGSNASSVFAEAISSIIVKPKPYTIGKSLDYVRMFQNYDWSYEVAKVYAGLMFAKYKLLVSKMFNNATLQDTPFNQVNFTAATYTQLASDLGMFADGSGVTAYGTIPAWQAISALATQGGFETKDDYIRNAYLQKIYGVDSMILAQFTNASSPFTSATASTLRVVPNNKILLVPNGGDTPLKLVEEDYIRVKEVDAQDNSLNRMEFICTQSFDAEIATGNPYGIVGTVAGS